MRGDKEGKTFLANALLLTGAGMAAKAIGALYRIPLAGLVGGYGMGLYAMAYPLFCLFLTFSSTGIPTALARLAAHRRARGEDARPVVGAALPLFLRMGGLGTLLMAALSPLAAKLQGENALGVCYLALAPSVVLVAAIAVFRGYFQGKGEMAPTALSELAEQLVKAGLGLALAYRFRADPARAVSCALFAVTLSEVAALLVLWNRYRGEPRRRRLYGMRGEILPSVLPVMASCALLPLSQTVDSVLIVRLLKENAVSRFGIFSAALSLVSLPASLSYGVSSAIVPQVASHAAKGERKEGTLRALFALGLTLCISAPAGIVLFFGAGKIAAILYPALQEGERALLARLIRTLALPGALLAGTDALAACLAGLGRAKKSLVAMSAAVGCKTALQLSLVPALGVLGAGIAQSACYTVAFFLDLVYTVKKEEKDDHRHRIRRRSRSRQESEGSARGSGRSAPAYRTDRGAGA